jgi:hypothetical protein
MTDGLAQDVSLEDDTQMFDHLDSICRLEEAFQLWFYPDGKQKAEHDKLSVCYHRVQGTRVDVQVLANSYAHSIGQGSEIWSDVPRHGSHTISLPDSMQHLVMQKGGGRYKERRSICSSSKQHTTHQMQPEDIHRRIRLLSQQLHCLLSTR